MGKCHKSVKKARCKDRASQEMWIKGSTWGNMSHTDVCISVRDEDPKSHIAGGCEPRNTDKEAKQGKYIRVTGHGNKVGMGPGLSGG